LAVPGPDLSSESLQIGNSPVPEALPRQDADFDFSLVQPTAVSGRVVYGKPIPDFSADLFSEQIRHGFAAMDVDYP